MIALWGLLKPVTAFLSNPKVLLGLACVIALIVSYTMGKNAEKRAQDRAIRIAVEEALSLSGIEVRRYIERERESTRIIEEFNNRDDQESIDWASKPIPAGELERLHTAVEQLSANP
jgi:hypothetical protein